MLRRMDDDNTSNILQAIRIVAEAGLEIELIVMNPEYEKKVSDELNAPEGMVKSDKPIQYFHGFLIILNDRVKDFFIVTDEHWAQQMSRYIESVI